MLLILCEGPSCNGGMGAQTRAREIALTRPSASASSEQRAESLKGIRSEVSGQLTYTWHRPIGATGAVCTVCGHTRVFGVPRVPYGLPGPGPR